MEVGLQMSVNKTSPILILSIFLLVNVCFAEEKKFYLESSAFENNASIPKLYTCKGKNISPPLSWANIPKDTKSLALLVDDPDAPSGSWTHWIMYNIPPTSKGLKENVLPVEEFAHTAKQGLNDFQTIGYGGPCPPSGTHRYFFKLYALNNKINIEGTATKESLLKSIEGHALEKVELVGKYKG